VPVGPFVCANAVGVLEVYTECVVCLGGGKVVAGVSVVVECLEQ
jgi:hypothetical protein